MLCSQSVDPQSPNVHPNGSGGRRLSSNEPQGFLLALIFEMVGYNVLVFNLSFILRFPSLARDSITRAPVYPTWHASLQLMASPNASRHFHSRIITSDEDVWLCTFLMVVKSV